MWGTDTEPLHACGQQAWAREGSSSPPQARAPPRLQERPTPRHGERQMNSGRECASLMLVNCSWFLGL